MASNAVKQAVKAPSKLQKILANLNAAPRLDLTGVKTLKLTYAYRNDHWGARWVLPLLFWVLHTVILRWLVIVGIYYKVYFPRIASRKYR